MILGFTGTRQGLSYAQRAFMRSTFGVLPHRVLHGGAVGADSDFHIWVRQLRHIVQTIEIFPASIERYAYWFGRYADSPAVVIHPVFNPLARNRIIAQRCDHLLACPAEPEEQLRSGTWATVRYAREEKKPITLLLPDGSLKREPAR